MSYLKLKAGRNFVPQGMDFVDPRTKRTFSGYQLSIEGAVRSIIQHRTANPTVYPAREAQWFNEVLVKQEYFRQLYEKDKSLFQGNGAIVNPPVQTKLPPVCSCGGTAFTPGYCPTCSGQRILNFKCDKCGKIYTP